MTRKSSPFQSRKIVPITMATTPAPRPISRQSTMGSIVRRSVVSMSGINLETMSLASIPPAVESPEPDKEEEYNPRLNGAKKTLFQAARKCDSATIVKTLEEWPNMKLNFVDEQGKTLLHHCVNAGNKNDVIVLLGRGAPINRVDNNGHTALHYAAKKDFTDIVEMLVVHGASINLPEEKTGQTALSFAVAKNYMSTAEFLLFCGANANLKDRSGKAPIAHCRSIEMRTLLANASPSSSKTRGMCLQTVQVQGGNITRCWKLEMTIDYSSGPADDKFSLMCRRQATDESPIDFHLDHTDEVFSDVFQFKLGRKGKPTALKLMIPIFALPEKNEELVLKSNKGHVIVIDSILREEHEIPLCLVKADISTFDAFIIVARPKCEEFNVPEGGGIFSSKIYTNIAISVPVGAFSDPVTLLMQVIYPPSSDVLESKQLQNVYSSTPFCFLKEKNGIKPKVPITLFLPVPDIYGVGKELRAYHAVCDSMQLIQGNSWQPINCSVKYEQQALNIPVNCDGTSVLVETKPEVKQDVLTPEVGLLYFKSVRLEYSVAFIVMTKVEESTHSFRTVVECNTLENATKAKKSWQDEGFVDQHPLNTASFKGYSRQLYKIKVSKNLRSNEDFDGDFYVQFHIKRPNCILLSGAYKNLPNPEKGNIQVLETDRKDHFVDQEQIKSNDKHLTTLSVVMDKDPGSVPVAPKISVKEPSALEKPKVTEVKPKSTSKIKGDPSFKGFTQDDFLRMIANELDEEWYKVVVLMGWSFAEVDKVYRDGNLCQSDKILQFLLQWRDSNRTKDDLGIPALLTAFSKGGRKDLCTVVQLRMKEWLDDDSNQKTKFWRWIQKAFKDSDLINPGDYPRPMSDQFLLLLTQVECNLKIGDHLDGASDQLATMNAVSDAAEYMQLKYLTKMRGHTKDQSKAFRNLLAVLKKLEMNDALRWSIMASQEWLWNTESEETPFGVELETILYDYKNISSEQKT